MSDLITYTGLSDIGIDPNYDLISRREYRIFVNNTKMNWVFNDYGWVEHKMFFSVKGGTMPFPFQPLPKASRI